MQSEFTALQGVTHDSVKELEARILTKKNL